MKLSIKTINIIFFTVLIIFFAYALFPIEETELKNVPQENKNKSWEIQKCSNVGYCSTTYCYGNKDFRYYACKPIGKKYFFYKIIRK